MTTYSFTDVSDLVYELQQFIDDQIEEAQEGAEEELLYKIYALEEEIEELKDEIKYLKENGND